MKTVKRTLSLCLALALLCGALALPASAATVENTAATTVTVNASMAANILYDLGLFEGMGTLPSGRPDFALDQTANRTQAAVMLVRVLGAEQEAKSNRYKNPYTDVPTWADGYVGYAVAKNITNGMGSNFGAASTITANQFVTQMLRALGYSSVDYRNPAPTARAVGLTYPSGTTFTRGDMVQVCYSALSCKVSGTGKTLSQQLVSNGVISSTQAFYAGLFNKYEGFNATMSLEGDYLNNYYPGLSAIATKQRTIYGTMISAAVGEIALVEVSRAADVQKVKDIFQARIDAQVGTDDEPGGAWYPASIEGWKTGSRIVSKGNYVMMVAFPSAADQIVADFNQQF